MTQVSRSGTDPIQEDDVPDHAMACAFGVIAAIIAAVGAYLIWGVGAALLCGGGMIALIAAAMIMRPPAALMNSQTSRGQNEHQAPRTAIQQ